jgi:formylglycine-generating enzyme
MDFAPIADMVFPVLSRCLMEHGLQEVLFVEPHILIERAQQYAKSQVLPESQTSIITIAM